MLVPLSWLNDFVDVTLPAEKVDDLLTNAGLEVKHLSRIGVPGADLEWQRDKFVLSRIVSVEQHPDADRLVLATVDHGAESLRTVVTGAPNLFPYVGQDDITQLNLFSPLVLEGATLYDGHKEGFKKTKLKGRELRGIYNDAMLCSEKELGISEEHEGIILIQKDAWSPDYQVGTPLQDVLGDTVLEIDIIPNIARCASILGVAREYAALTGQTLRPLDSEVVMDGPDMRHQVQITTDHPELNPRFVGLVIQNVSQQQSPYWMQHRLRLAGQRPINVVVDISNYVMLEMGQPNHTFEYDFLRRRADDYNPDGPIRIHTRLPEPDETLNTLDGIEHKLPPFTILVTDPAGNLSLGGIMGGADSEIKPETTNVLLEAAAWNYINIRRSANRMGIATDAAFRFSRGVHPSQALLGAKRAAELLRRLAGGTVCSGIIDTYPAPPQAETVALDADYVRQLSGLALTPDEMADLLQRLGFGVEVAGNQLRVVTPDHRMDIEGPHDLVEEICRMYGYDNIPSTIMADVLPPQRGNPQLEREERIRDLLVQIGLYEVMTYRLTAPEREVLLQPDGQTADDGYVSLTNPISSDRTVMRRNLLSSVLEVAARNLRFHDRFAVFEIGSVYLPIADQQLPEERMRLSILVTGLRQPASWQDASAAAMMDFFDLKGMLGRLFDGLKLPVATQAGAHPSFRPGRTAQLVLGQLQLGVMGELHPLVVEGFDLHVEADQAVLAADLDLEAIIAAMSDSHTYAPVSAYPAVHEDLALVVDSDIPAAELEAALRQAGGFLLKTATPFDVYTGKQVGAGKKSIAYHLTFQAPNRTLTDKDVAKVRNNIIKKLGKQLGAVLRA